MTARVRRAANPWDRFYRHHEAPWRGETQVAELLPLLGAGPVLELGCGNGKTLRPLLRADARREGPDVSDGPRGPDGPGGPRGPDGSDGFALAPPGVVGLDVSFHALRRLRAPGPAGEGAPTVPRALVLADAARLPFPDASFTCVLDIHCSGHLGRAGRLAAMAECARVLQGGGHLVVERLGPGDLRASQGQPVEGEPDMRQVEDRRRTAFSSAQDLAAEAAEGAAGALQPEAAHVDRKHPGHRGRQVTRESVRAVFVRGPRAA